MSGAPRTWARERPFHGPSTALLLIDVQNYVVNDRVAAEHPEFCRRTREVVLPNLGRLIAAMREQEAEVIYTVMENLTRDGRDRSLDYKLSGFFIAKGSWEAQVLDPVMPGADDILLPKTSSGVFNSTNIDYLLRNLGIETLILTGFLTDQCIDHTVRDAADRGYYPICVTDACATHTLQRHENALAAFKGYCRQLTTDRLLGEMRAVRSAAQ